MRINLRIGQKLRTTTNEYVTIIAFDEEMMDVLFRGKKYTRPISIIGVSLFPLEEDILEEDIGVETDESTESIDSENPAENTSSEDDKCPTWIWNEEADQLNWLHNEINDRVKANNESIERQRKYVNSGGYEEQDSNIVIATANKKIAELETEINNFDTFKKKPYIAHIALVSDNKETMNLYLTERHEPPIEMLSDESIIVSLSGEGELVQQIGSNYYNRSLENVSNNGTTYNYDFFRLIAIDDGKLKDVLPLLQIKGEDEHYTEKLKQITDMFLLEILNSRRDERNMPSIIATIQKHQYAIISEPEKSSYIVDGCAGSGKTAIMLHRLHFLKARKKKIDWKKVTIISPSKLFEEYSFQLMNELNLDMIKQVSIEDYYWSMLLEYDNYFKERTKEFVSYKDFDEEFIERFFSNETMEQIKDAVNHFISSTFDDASKYCDVDIKGKTIKERANALFEKTEAYIAGWKDYNDKLKEHPELEKSRTDYEYFEKETKKKEKQIKTISLELSKRWAEFSETVENDEKEKIQKKINKLMQKLTETQKEFEESRLLLNESKNEYDSLVASKVEGTEDYSKIENINDIRKLNSSLRNIERSIFSYVLKICLNPIRQEYGLNSYDSFIEMDTISKVELWTLLYIYYTVNGNEGISDEAILCIDEGQNINICEYMLIDEIKKDAAINIYGDLKQRLFKNVGIREWNELPDYKLFEMNQNYRNPEKIVQYCNSRLGLEMEGFGIVGDDVAEINSQEVSSMELSRSIDGTQVNNGGKVKIIVKNREAFDKLSKMYAGSNILCYDDEVNDEIKSARISVLPLSSVLGMEFPSVIVYSYGMTDSQKYIAYTRATKELMVVE